MGVQAVGWSGILALGSLLACWSYPATFATALALLLLDGLLRFRSGPVAPWLGLLCLLSALLVLVNAATALGAAASAAGLVLGGHSRWRPWRLAALSAPAAAGLVALLCWPYFGLATLLGRGEGFDEVQAQLLDHPLGFYGFALLGLPALWRDRRRPLGWELIGVFAVCVVVIAAGMAVGSTARLIPFPVLALHLALARHLAVQAGRLGAYRKVIAVATVVGACVTSGSAVLRALPPDLRLGRYQDVGTHFLFVLRYLRPGDVLLTADLAAARSLSVHGVRSVAPGYEHFFVPDEERRLLAVRRFMDARTSVWERDRIAGEYRARCVLTTSPPAVPLPGFTLREAASDDLALYCRR